MYGRMELFLAVFRGFRVPFYLQMESKRKGKYVVPTVAHFDSNVP